METKKTIIKCSCGNVIVSNDQQLKTIQCFNCGAIHEKNEKGFFEETSLKIKHSKNTLLNVLKQQLRQYQKRGENLKAQQIQKLIYISQ
jgi:hypothetical protein